MGSARPFEMTNGTHYNGHTTPYTQPIITRIFATTVPEPVDMQNYTRKTLQVVLLCTAFVTFSTPQILSRSPNQGAPLYAKTPTHPRPSSYSNCPA